MNVSSIFKIVSQTKTFFTDYEDTALEISWHNHLFYKFYHHYGKHLILSSGNEGLPNI